MHLLQVSGGAVVVQTNKNGASGRTGAVDPKSFASIYYYLATKLSIE
jgi:hypothetical protein